MLKNKYLLVFALILVLSACAKDNDDDIVTPIAQNGAEAYDAKVVTEWYDLIKTLTIQTPGYTPPVAARAFGYTSIALYEAVVPGIPNKVSLSGKLTDLNFSTQLEQNKIYHWPTVANAVLGRMTEYFYADTSEDRLKAIAGLEEKFDTAFLVENGSDVHEVSVNLGKDVANAILAWSETDGGKDAQFNNFPNDYVPPVGDQFWVPTAPKFQSALQPYWGSNRPFLMSNITGGARPVPPPPFSVDESSVCYQRALEVYNVVNSLTPDQRDIAEFWSDDPVTTATPPGHSISI
ncbi:MAG TPA: hypothetical protein ENH60_10890, partial [Pricia sp.]|nr:hypothetical protein [Pricia sp.]